MVFAFMNLKGGVGKTKLNSYFATYVASKGYKVLLIDSDVSQHTTEVFTEEIPEGMHLDVLQYNTDYGNLDVIIENSKSSYDLVIVDFPGTVQQEGVIPLISEMDFVVVPTPPDEEDLHSTKKFALILDQLEVPYNVLINNYEVQFYGMVEHEKNGFREFNKLFDGKVFPIGIRKERSLLQQNFALGRYGGHKNTARVEEALNQVLTKIGIHERQNG